jgi:hypothetical protein
MLRDLLAQASSLTACQTCIFNRFRKIADMEKTCGSQNGQAYNGKWYDEGRWKKNVIVGTPKPIPQIYKVVKRDKEYREKD